MVIKATIKKMFNNSTSLKAFVDVEIDSSVVIHSVAVRESEKGLYVSMPYTKWKNKNGEDKQHDVVHPVTSSARKQIEEAVLSAYEIHSRNN